ncbi:MAG: type II 3-dehydroquinate dehydratase [Legionellales bacterium RIFCSPHIGHO2_12_FULL_42_9]|nr:MAG: type II 3-dehydroquinate dehydratase [Legionellales bacterium RIFCSPHIGHO2_12_FULL_42_9]
MKTILVLNGPNLDRLGLRETSIYGKITLDELNAILITKAENLGMCLSCFQTNSEAKFIETIHHAADTQINYLIVNAAAFTHTSIAIRDALLAAAIPFIEVHISNIYAREGFRRLSYLSDIAMGVISGLGVDGYLLALQAILKDDM